MITPAVSKNGTVLYHASLRGAGIDNSNKGTLWLDRANTRELIARTGSAGPGPNLGSIPFSLFESFTLNANDDVAFLARLAEPNAQQGYSAGIWTKLNGSTTLDVKARTGVAGLTANLDPAVSFVEVSAPVLNSNRAIAFRGVAKGPGINAAVGEGIWTNASGELRAIALGNSAVPSLDTGLGNGIYCHNDGYKTLAFRRILQVLRFARLAGWKIIARGRTVASISSITLYG